MSLAEDPSLRAAVEEALSRPPDEQLLQPPPALILTGLALEVGPVLFQGQQAVALTIKNQIGHATIPIPIDQIDGLITQLTAAKAIAGGLRLAPAAGLITP